MDIDLPVTDVEAADLISLLQSPAYPQAQMIVRRLIFERDHLRNKLQTIDDLAMLVRRLARKVELNHPDFAEKAMDYLKRKGLQGSPLRSTSE